jgi:hypothetical protein
MKQMKRFFTSTRGRTILSVLFVTLMVAMFVSTMVMATASRPSRSSTASSYELFRNASPFAANYVIDKPRVWLPASGGSEVTVASLVGLGAGTPVPTECNTSEIGGFLLDASTESFSVLFPLPADIDVAEDVRLRALWSNSEAAATGSGLITFLYEPFTIGTTAIAVADDACDTDGGVVVDLAANVLTWSNWSTIDGGTITITPGDDFVILRGVATLDTIADMTVYGYQLEYKRKWLGGDGSY